MQILLSAPALSGFSLDSLRNHIDHRFQALKKHIPQFVGEYKVRLVVHKEKNNYSVSVEITLPKPVFIHTSDVNLFAAVDNAVRLIKRSLQREKGKKRSLKRK